MKVSLNTVKQYINFDLPPLEELTVAINSQLGAIEEVSELFDKYSDAKIVKVVECSKHPDADRLSVCMIDAGLDSLVQVVCGAPNVKAGMWAVWLPPESIVPSTYGTDDEFRLGARELRGVMSNGMLAAGDELAINDDHDGILEIDPLEYVPSGVGIEPGASFARVYGLDDTIIDIENKMFTHRPDLFGQLGVAREIAGIFGKGFTSPDWYSSIPEFESSNNLSLEVFNSAGEMAPRFMAVTVDNVEVKPSPLWLQCALVAMGSKSINNIVDITNYVMLLTAQPTHAYDYDKVRGGKIGVRMASDGESVTLLNGKTYELNQDDVVIADANGVIGLGGIMGGIDAEVSDTTTRVVIEVATFDMYALRRSSMRHGLFTDALTRFNKGQSPLQNDKVLSFLLSNMANVSQSIQPGEVSDIRTLDIEKRHSDYRAAAEIFDLKSINSRLGVEFTSEEVLTLLGNTEILPRDDLSDNNDANIKVRVPFWRMDLSCMEDMLEEVGRLHGYDLLPRSLPLRSTKPAPKNTSRELAGIIRDTLSRAGANEVLTYSFVHRKIIERAGQNTDEAYSIVNALSPDLQFYRLSLTPSLLDKVNGNIKSGYDEFSLFEIGKVHSKRAVSEVDGLPASMRRVAMVYASKNDLPGSPYYRAKAQLEFLTTRLGLSVTYKKLPVESSLMVSRPFEPVRGARVIDTLSQQVIGIIGEYTAGARRAFKLPNYSAGFELIPEAIEIALSKSEQQYRPLSRYPRVSRDVCFKIASEVMYQQVVDSVVAGIDSGDVDVEVSPVDIYQSDGSETKNVTLRIELSPKTKTLSGEEASAIIANIIQGVVSTVGAEVV